MKKQLIAFILPFALLCATAADAFVEKKAAVVWVMNKAAGKVRQISVPVGGSAEFEKLTIAVKTCKQTDPFQAEDFFMFVEIHKNSEGKIFSGWMTRNEPGDNPLQNADYDLWLAKCE